MKTILTMKIQSVIGMTMTMSHTDLDLTVERHMQANITVPLQICTIILFTYIVLKGLVITKVSTCAFRLAVEMPT